MFPELPLWATDKPCEMLRLRHTAARRSRWICGARDGPASLQYVKEFSEQLEQLLTTSGG
jgi:hypothetical protein